jgi:hypothetical protein
MNTTQETAKQRVQFDFSTEAIQRLETLKELTDASTKAEVVRNALKIYEWFVTEVDLEDTIEIQNKEGKAVFRIPLKVLLS